MTLKKSPLISKRSQSEIVGIAIVMVLIMLGIIFVIRFVILPQNQNQSLWGIYDRNQMASDLIDTVLKTSTNCNTRTVSELIRDCTEHYNVPTLQYHCEPDSALINTPCSSTGCGSCDFLKSVVGHISNETLDTMYVRYDLMICRWDEITTECATGPTDMLFSKSHDSCKNDPNSDYDFKQVPIPTDVDIRSVVMYICDY